MLEGVVIDDTELSTIGSRSGRTSTTTTADAGTRGPDPNERLRQKTTSAV
jgi:hypothetical protein